MNSMNAAHETNETETRNDRGMKDFDSKYGSMSQMVSGASTQLVTQTQEETMQVGRLRSILESNGYNVQATAVAPSSDDELSRIVDGDVRVPRGESTAEQNVMPMFVAAITRLRQQEEEMRAMLAELQTAREELADTTDELATTRRDLVRESSERYRLEREMAAYRGHMQEMASMLGLE